VTSILVDIEGIKKESACHLVDSLYTLIINLAEIQTSVSLQNIATNHRDDDVRDRLQKVCIFG
jgi:hypothetical protein